MIKAAFFYLTLY